MKLGKLSLIGLSALSMAMALSANSFADARDDHKPGYERDLELRVRDLEFQVTDLTRSLRKLEKRVDQLSSGPSYPPAPPVENRASCMLVDSGYAKTFLGVAKTKLDAEYNARAACQAVISAAYCGGSALLKCDDTLNAPPYATGYTCMVTDSGYGKIFRGSGRTAIEAEAKAKQSCQDSVNANYCGRVQARCEAQQ